MRHVMVAILLVSTLASGAAAQGSDPAGAMRTYDVGAVRWGPGPATMPTGTQLAVLEGDPTKAGMFTIRIKFPAGMHIAPHFHTQVEHATVVAGTLHIGMGVRFDSAATTPLRAGSFGFWPAGMRHFAWMEGETVLQLHGQGPWTVTYVNAADDPRRSAPGAIR